MSCSQTIENKESIANELQTVIHILLETKKVIIFVVDANNKIMPTKQMYYLTIASWHDGHPCALEWIIWMHN